MDSMKEPVELQVIYFDVSSIDCINECYWNQRHTFEPCLIYKQSVIYWPDHIFNNKYKLICTMLNYCMVGGKMWTPELL